MADSEVPKAPVGIVSLVEGTSNNILSPDVGASVDAISKEFVVPGSSRQVVEYARRVDKAYTYTTHTSSNLARISLPALNKHEKPGDDSYETVLTTGPTPVDHQILHPMQQLKRKDLEIEQLLYWLSGRGEQTGELFWRIDEEQSARKEAGEVIERKRKEYKKLKAQFLVALDAIRDRDEVIAAQKCETAKLTIHLSELSRPAAGSTSPRPRTRVNTVQVVQRSHSRADASDATSHGSGWESQDARRLNALISALEAARSHILDQNQRLVEQNSALADLQKSMDNVCDCYEASSDELKMVKRNKAGLEHKLAEARARIDEAEEVNRKTVEVYDEVVGKNDKLMGIAGRNEAEIESLRECFSAASRKWSELEACAGREHEAQVQAERLLHSARQGGRDQHH